MIPTQQFNYNQQDFTNHPYTTNRSSIMEMQNQNDALQQYGDYTPSNQNFPMQNYQIQYYYVSPQQQMVQLPPVNYNDAVQQQINQYTRQFMNFPPELPCDKPDPFKFRNNPMQMERSYWSKNFSQDNLRLQIIRLSNEQFYKIELLRINMLNHIAQCNNPQCESVYAAHIDDGKLPETLCIEKKRNKQPNGIPDQPAPPLIRIGHNKGLHCALMPTIYYLLMIFCPLYWLCCPCFISGHCQNYDISECQEATILNNESMNLQIDANRNYQCQHSCCCKYTGQRK